MQRVSKILSFIGLQLKLKNRFAEGNKKGAAVSVILSVLTFCVIMGLFYAFSGVLVQSLGDRADTLQAAMVFVTLIEVVLTVVAVTSQIKYLFRQSDAVITARFPLSGFEIFIANAMIVYVNLLIYSLFLTIPIMYVFGLAAHAFTVQYAFLVILAALLAPMIPFAISVVLAVPVMYFLALLENHNYIKLFIFIACVVAFFVLYDYMLRMMADYFIYKQVSGQTVDIWDKIIKVLCSHFNPALYVGQLMFAQRVSLDITMILCLFFSVLAIGITIAIPVYGSVRRRTLEGVRSILNKKSRLTDDGPFRAIFKREFKEIIRTKIYAYFYLGIAVAAPVMVFFCNRLVTEVGKAQLGPTVAFGTSVLVITCFMTMINVFAASVIGKEGERFYITKIIPVPYKTQLLIKGSLNLIVSSGALIISCFVIGVLDFVTLEQVFVIAALETVVAAALVLNGFNLNLKRPNIFKRTDGDVDETNVTVMMIIGIALSAVMGGSTIIISFSQPVWITYCILFALVAIYFAVNAAVFFATADKKYRSIER